ncbi:MAG: sulfur carrier protein ThiS [Pyrinomonadaceae bacterium]
MHVTINGEKREVPDGVDMSTLLELFSLPSQRVAVELNREVVRRADWNDTRLSEGDRIEVIHFVGGG